jgi:hypothetical protein
MPYVITKNFSDYSVINPISGHIYSKHTTFNRAKKQLEQNLTVPHLPIKGVMGDIPHYFINYK